VAQSPIDAVALVFLEGYDSQRLAALRAKEASK